VNKNGLFLDHGRVGIPHRADPKNHDALNGFALAANKSNNSMVLAQSRINLFGKLAGVGLKEPVFLSRLNGDNHNFIDVFRHSDANMKVV
jgi:hypothetical protein